MVQEGPNSMSYREEAWWEKEVGRRCRARRGLWSPGPSSTVTENSRTLKFTSQGFERECSSDVTSMETFLDEDRPETRI